MAKTEQMLRLAFIVNKFQGTHRCIPGSELMSAVAGGLTLRGYNAAGDSLRTLQRDLEMLRNVFGVNIVYDKGGDGYRLEERDNDNHFADLLLNFELLSAISADSVMQKYVLPEHRRVSVDTDFPLLLDAIRTQRAVAFDYTLVRQGNKLIHVRLHPYFLKESQRRWYLIGYDEGKKLKSFALDRMEHIEIDTLDHFTRNDEIDVPALFRESFGIWNNPDDPVEEIVLKYDALDGSFVKSLPLHHTQEIVSDGDEGVTVRLRLRITNDFVMALLARSRSLEVVKPASLRQRICEVYRAALQRNSIHE